MDEFPDYKTAAEHQRVYDLIWTQMPQMQKRTSSSWWFFLLFPKGEAGYGPRQLMFSLATRVGEQIRINERWLPGLDLQRPFSPILDQFPAMTVGWYCDGAEMREGYVQATAVTTLSASEQFVRSFDERGYGLEMKSGERPLSIETRVQGQGGNAHFHAWGDLDCLHNSPHESINLDTPLGGTHFIAWRRMNFAGEFDLPTGRERLEGLGYFQRVCLNVPTFPWKWIWALFPDGSMFTAYVPYVGLNLLRRGYRFFADERMEGTAVSISAAAFWDPAGPAERRRFNGVSVTPHLGDPFPYFEVRAGDPSGDYLNFRAAPYSRANMTLDRPLFGGWLRSHWNYNEYLFRMEEVNGRVNGQTVTLETMGQGFGNLEYTWGLGL